MLEDDVELLALLHWSLLRRQEGLEHLLLAPKATERIGDADARQVWHLRDCMSQHLDRELRLLEK